MSQHTHEYHIKHLAIQFCVSLTLFSLANVCLWIMTSNYPSHRIPREVSAGTRTIRVFLFGNSLMANGVDKTGFVATGPVMNVGLPGTMMVEHRLVLNHVVLKESDKPIIVEGFFDLQLLETPPPSLIGIRALSYYETPSLAAKYYYPDNPVEQAMFRVSGCLPFVTERSALWEKVEKIRQDISQIDMRRANALKAYNGAEADNQEAFRRRCANVLRKSLLCTQETRDFIVKAKEVGSRVVFVEMPMTSYHRSNFYGSDEWRQLKIRQQTELVNAGVEYIDASGWITDDALFLDHIHLSKEGARQFSRRLDAYLAGK